MLKLTLRDGDVVYVRVAAIRYMYETTAEDGKLVTYLNIDGGNGMYVQERMSSILPVIPNIGQNP